MGPCFPTNGPRQHPRVCQGSLKPRVVDFPFAQKGKTHGGRGNVQVDNVRTRCKETHGGGNLGCDTKGTLMKVTR